MKLIDKKKSYKTHAETRGPRLNHGYSVKYDAYHDETGEWLEPKCGDPGCFYCSHRPDRALIPRLWDK